MNGNHFLNTDLLLASGNSFLARGNHFLPVPQMLFKEFFIRIFIFWSRRKSIAFYFELFFPASQYHYLNYREFKTLITAIGKDFI